jgi:hypothetical protein
MGVNGCLPFLFPFKLLFFQNLSKTGNLSRPSSRKIKLKFMAYFSPLAKVQQRATFTTPTTTNSPQNDHVKLLIFPKPPLKTQQNHKFPPSPPPAKKLQKTVT